MRFRLRPSGLLAPEPSESPASVTGAADVAAAEPEVAARPAYTGPALALDQLGRRPEQVPTFRQMQEAWDRVDGGDW